MVDDAFIAKLYDDVTSLYHLDQIQQTGEPEGGGANPGYQSKSAKDLGPLPKASKVLLISLLAAWLILGSIASIRAFRTKASQKAAEK